MSVIRFLSLKIYLSAASWRTILRFEFDGSYSTTEAQALWSFFMNSTEQFPEERYSG